MMTSINLNTFKRSNKLLVTPPKIREFIFPKNFSRDADGNIIMEVVGSQPFKMFRVEMAAEQD